MPKNSTKEEDFLNSLPNSENDFLAGIPDSTPTGLPKLSASPTPTIDSAQTTPPVDPELITTGLQAGSSQPMQTPVPDESGVTPPAGRPAMSGGDVALNIAKDSLPGVGMAGGTALGIAAAPATGGISLLLPAIGAILGYAGGKSGGDLLERAFGKKAPLNNLPDALVETGENLKEGAMNELGGQVMGAAIIKPVSKMMAPLAGKAAEVGMNAMQSIMTKAEQYGIKLTPAEVTQSKGLQLLENFLSNVPFSAGKIQKFRAAQLGELVKAREVLIDKGGGEKPLEEVGLRIRNMVDDAVKDYNNFSEENLARLKDRVLAKAGSPETYHDLIQPLQSINEKNITRLRGVKNTLYQNAKDLMPDDLTIVPENLVTTAQTFRDEMLKVNPQLQDKQTLGILNSIIDSRDTPITADTLLANRKALNDLVAKDTNFMTGEMGPGARMYKQMVNGIDADMNAMAESTGNKTIIDAQAIANKANSDYKNYVKDPLVKRIAESKRPDAIIGAVYSPGNDTEIKKFQEHYGPEFADRAKKVFTNSFLGLTPDPNLPDQQLTGDFVRGQMQKFGTTLNSIYSPSEIGYLKDVADVLDGQKELATSVIKNPVMRSIISSPRASGIIDLIVKPKDVGNLSVIKQYVGEDGIKEIQNGLLNKLLVKNQIGTFAPQTFAKEFDKYEPRVLKAALPEEVYNDLKKLSDVAIRAGGAEKMAGNPSGTARNMLIPVGIGFMLHNPVTTGSLILGSRAFTELYLSNVGRKWLTEGFSLPATSDAAVKVASKITLLMLEQQKKQLEKHQGEQQ